MTTTRRTQPVGSCAIVLHAHLPWLAHHGVWPVGEEWLYQAWAATYLPVVDLLNRLAGHGHRHLFTLGITPVLAAQLDDPFLLRQFHLWLADWQLRADSLATSADRAMRDLAAVEWATANRALGQFEDRWRHGGSPVLRRLADDDVVELLGGPATHPILPALDSRWRRFALGAGLADAQLRVGRRPRGAWLPECAYRPGLEIDVAASGMRHVVVDEVTLPDGAMTLDGGRPIGSSGVVGFANDWALVQLVWGAPDGYPSGPWYRDFHAFEPTTGLRLQRITGRDVSAADKAGYDPAAAERAAASDAAAFADAIRTRLLDHRAQFGRPGLAVIATDAELFGHWWHEGPTFLEHLLRRLPEAGVRLTTLGRAVDDDLVGDPVEARPGTWGVAKDFRVWEGPAVPELSAAQHDLQRAAADAIDQQLRPGDGRRPDLDQLAREVLLATASDWPFLISHDQGAAYARSRFAGHRDAVTSLVEALHRDDGSAAELAQRLRAVDGPFGHLDARLLRH